MTSIALPLEKAWITSSEWALLLPSAALTARALTMLNLGHKTVAGVLTVWQIRYNYCTIAPLLK